MCPTSFYNQPSLFEELFYVSSCVTKGVMYLTPLGILGLMVPVIAQNGPGVLMPLIKVILIFYLGVVIQTVLVYCVSLKFMGKKHVGEFFKHMFPAQIVAFVSCSSAAALPISMQCVEEKLHVSKETSSFVLPFGSTVNMDGNALYQGIIALFIAQAYGIELTLTMQAIIVLTGTIASIGAAGVPGAGMIVLSTVLASVGLPVDGIALVAGFDRILDMGRTFINVTGDAVTACVIDRFMNRVK